VYRRPSYEVARHGARSEPVEFDHDPPVAPEIRRSALWVRLVVAGLALVAIAVTAVLGGFDQVASDEPDTLPVVAVDEEFNGGPWLITVESAQIGRNLRDYRPPTEGDLVLQVNVRIVKIDNCACGILDAIDIREFPGLTPDLATTRSLRDNTLALDAQIGLPIRVAYLWVIANGSSVPKEITVVINGAIRRYQNFRFLGTTIEIVEPKATVGVPVLDRTGAA
jgi:hypothetical protein